MLFLIGCTTGTQDSPPPKTSDPSWKWESSGTANCSSPQEPAWTQQDLPSWSTPIPDTIEEGVTEPGAVGWWETKEETWMLYTRHTTELVAIEMSTHEVKTWDTHGFVSNISQGDLDNDGTQDLLITAGQPMVFYSFLTENEQLIALGNRETDRAARDIVPLDGNHDGDLDLVISYIGRDPSVFAYSYFENQGNQQFEQRTIEAPDEFWGYNFDVMVLDFDQDGDPDLLACNDRGDELVPNQVLENDGQGGFTPATDARGLDFTSNCMGLVAGDVDRNGMLDIYIGDSEHSFVLLQDEAGFYDAGSAMGLPSFPENHMVWGNAITDLDNDGDTDLVANFGDFFEPGAIANPMSVFSQDSGVFTESFPFVQDGYGRGLVLVDANDDGVLDLLVGQAFQAPTLFLSQGCTQGAWLSVEAPAGSTVLVEAGGQPIAALASTEHGWGSTGPARVHFGLGSLESVDNLTVILPWGEEITYEGTIPARQRVTLTNE